MRRCRRLQEAQPSAPRHRLMTASHRQGPLPIPPNHPLPPGPRRLRLPQIRKAAENHRRHQEVKATPHPNRRISHRLRLAAAANPRNAVPFPQKSRRKQPIQDPPLSSHKGPHHQMDLLDCGIYSTSTMSAFGMSADWNCSRMRPPTSSVDSAVRTRELPPPRTSSGNPCSGRLKRVSFARNTPACQMSK